MNENKLYLFIEELLKWCRDNECWPSLCNNGIIDQEEECDTAGETIEGCTSECFHESGWACSG